MKILITQEIVDEALEACGKKPGTVYDHFDGGVTHNCVVAKALASRGIDAVVMYGHIDAMLPDGKKVVIRPVPKDIHDVMVMFDGDAVKTIPATPYAIVGTLIDVPIPSSK